MERVGMPLPRREKCDMCFVWGQCWATFDALGKAWPKLCAGCFEFVTGLAPTAVAS